MRRILFGPIGGQSRKLANGLMETRQELGIVGKERTVAFFETSEQLAALVAYQERTDVQVQLIAVTPEADYAAEVCGLDYQVIEDFYSDAALMELGVRNFARLEALCLKMDRYLQAALANLSGGDLVSTLPQFYYLKGLFDGALHRSLTVTAVFAGTCPQAVISFDVPSPEQDITSFLQSNRLVSRLVPLVARRQGVRSIVLPSDRRRFRLINGQEVRAMIKQIPGVPGLLQVLRRRRWQLERIIRRGDSWLPFADEVCQDHPILICGSEDHFPAHEVVAEWERSYPGCRLPPQEIVRAVQHTDGPDLDHLRADARRACAITWRNLSRDTEFRSFFKIGLLDLYPLLVPFIKRLLLNIPDTLRVAEAFRRGLAQLPPSVLLMSSGGQYFGLAAHHAGRPAVVFQHGGANGYFDLPMIEYSELYGASHFFCPGQGTATYLEQPSLHFPRRSEAPRAVPTAVGLPVLDSLLKRERAASQKTLSPANARTVLYVLTNLGGDRRYFNYHMYPDIWFWRLQQQVIKTCVQFSDVHLIVKLYPPHDSVRREPIHNPVSDWLEDAQFPQCRVVHDRPFVDLLSVADLFIIDWPATTLMEALTTTKPIITLADPRWVRLDPVAAALLRKRVILSESGEQFPRDIAAVLSKTDWSLPGPVNDEFLRAYGTHCNDGQSAERAVAVLRDLALRGVGANTT